MSMTDNEVSTDIDTIDEATASAPSADVASRVSNLGAANGGAYSSFTGTDFATRMAVADAVINAERIADHVNETLMIANVIAQTVQFTNEDTGEVTTAPRVTLVTEDGTAYVATSVGVLTSVANLISILGQPSTWPHPVPIRVVQRGNVPRRYFTFELDTAALAKMSKPSK